jgi:hypothetical protein
MSQLMRKWARAISTQQEALTTCWDIDFMKELLKGNLTQFLPA